MMGKLFGGRTAHQRRLDEQLSAFVDGELSAPERARLESRLASDPGLRAQLAALRRTVALVQEMPPVEVPRNFLLPRTAERTQRARRGTRARIAWAAPLLTAASTVVSALFVVALAGNLFTTARDRASEAPASAFEAPSAMVELGEEAIIEAEPQVDLTVVVEAESPVAAERAEEKAAAVPEEAVVEEAPKWEPAEAEIAETEAPAEDAPVPMPAAEGEIVDEEAQGVQALEIEAEASPEPPAAFAATATTDTAAGRREGPTPSSPAAKAVEPTTPAADDGSGEVADEDVVQPTQLPQAAAGEAEPVAATLDAELKTAQPEPDAEERAAPPRPTPPFPWLPLQVGLGAASVILVGATIWAWRLRR